MREVAKNYEIDMTRGSVLKSILIFSGPLILSGILQLLYTAADIVVVGRFAGPQALAAVGSTSSLIHLFVNLFISLSTGTSVLVARYFGARDYKSTQSALHSSIALSIVCGLIIMLIGLIFSKPALRLMDAPDDIIDLSALYMRIYFLGAPAGMLYNFGAMALRAVGDTKRPLYFLTVAGIVNVVLNLVLVVCFHMSVAGVAIATIVSQYISAALVFLSLMKTSGFCHLEIKKIRFHKNDIIDIIKIGLPAGVQSVVFSLSNVMVQSSINMFGSTVVAGNSAASNIEGFAYTAMNSMYTAAVTGVSQNFGAKKYDRIGRCVWACTFIVAVIGILMCSSMVLMKRPLMSLYSSEAAVIEAGVGRLNIVLATHTLCGLMEVFCGGTRGMGNTFLTMIVSIAGVCGIRMMWVVTVFAVFQTPTSLYLSYPASWAVTALLQLICFLIYKKRTIKKCMAQDAL